METVKWEYDAEKYAVTKFMDNKELLSRPVWYDKTKDSSERKNLSIVKISKSMATCSFYEFDRSVDKFVEKTGDFPVKNIQLNGFEAVNIEYEKILSKLDEESAAILRGLVWEKEMDAMAAGYNGCI